MRLDIYLVENNFFKSRAKAKQAILCKRVSVNGSIQKSSYEVKSADSVKLLELDKFVSLGGYKLDKAIENFDIDVSGKTFIDVGSSTGGFTHCLLLRGAKSGYCLDVGESLLDESLRYDSRIKIIDNTNARFLTENSLTETVDIAVVDCSFISLKIIIEPIFSVIKDNGFAIALIKPQFECGKIHLNKNGILRNKKVLKTVCLDIYNFCLEKGFIPTAFTNASVISGKNIEFLIMLKRGGIAISEKNISDLIDSLGDAE